MSEEDRHQCLKCGVATSSGYRNLCRPCADELGATRHHRLVKEAARELLNAHAIGAYLRRPFPHPGKPSRGFMQ